jgi:hypothetical protein
MYFSVDIFYASCAVDVKKMRLFFFAMSYQSAERYFLTKYSTEDTIVAGKPEGKSQFGRYRSIWEDNIKIDLNTFTARYLNPRGC